MISEKESLTAEINIGIIKIQPVLQEKEVTPTKQTQVIVNDNNYDGLSKVIVNSIPNEYIVPSGTQNIVQNGTYDVTDKDSAIVNVPEKVLGTKTITSNGTYEAEDDNLDGYSSVEVETSGVDINEYFAETISGSTMSSTWSSTINKLPAFENTGNLCSYMFNSFGGTSLDLSKFDTSQVINMRDMFSSCINLTSLDLSNFDTSNVTNMANMFYRCNRLTSLDLSNFDTSNVTEMASMFRDCINLTSLDLSNFDTSNVTNMANMFRSCSSLTSLDVSNFDTSNVTSIIYMFYYCSNLVNLSGLKDLGKGFTANSNNYSNYTVIFSYCNKLTHDSLMNVINNLYDLNLTYDVAGGGTLYTQSLQLGATNLAKLTAEEIAIAQNKGWNVS